MKSHHYLAMIFFFLVAYMVGVLYPSFGQTIKSKVGL